MDPRRSSARPIFALTALLAFAACGGAGPEAGGEPGATSVIGRLPTGRSLDPAGASAEVGSMPLAMVLAPGGDRVVLLLNGWREQGVQVVDRATGRVLQTLVQPAAFLGLAFNPRAPVLFASGGNQDVVYGYDWRGGRAVLRDSIVLAVKEPRRGGRRYPAGLAVSPDGTRLYVAENLADSLAVVDLGTGRVIQRLATERYPYGVAVAADGTVYASAWGGWTVSVFTPDGQGTLRDAGRIRVGRHPSAMVLSADGSRLYVASGSTDRVLVVDTRARRVAAELLDPPPAGPGEGSTPNALALSPDGKRLYVAEGDNNAVAVFDVAASSAGATRSGAASEASPGPPPDQSSSASRGESMAGSADFTESARADPRLLGRIPVGWYPTALIAAGDTLLVVSGKGRGTGPNPDLPHPPRRVAPGSRSYTLGQLSGTLTTLVAGRMTDAELRGHTERVARANAWDRPRPGRAAYPPFEHVVYIIKENRTYDQLLGDLPGGDGDTSLAMFGRSVTPNHHALAERFGIFDRFFVSAEVSADGHNWSTAAYTTDYLQKTLGSQYSGRGRDYDYEGSNRGFGIIPEDDVNEPAQGYLWDLAARAGITFRNYGEFVVPENVRPGESMPAGYKGTKPFLVANTSTAFPGYNLDITDQRRADVWLEEFAEFVRQGTMPALMIIRLPNDHTSYGRPGAPTPRAYVADNDLALGRIIEAITRSPFWKSTAVFVLEDDAQSGPDHVDSHRSPLFVISPYMRPGVNHRWANTTDVIATMAEILGLGSLSQFDYFGRPLREIWAKEPDLRPYALLRPAVDLNEKNPAEGGVGAAATAEFDLRFEDLGDDVAANRILWEIVKGGNVPYPGVTRMSALEWKRSH